MTTIENLSIEQLRQAIQIREQIDTLQAELEQVLGGGGGGIPSPFIIAEPVVPSKPGARHMSASARAAIGAAQRARWAKIRGEKPEASIDKPKRKMSAEGRAAIAAAARKRWKLAKAAGKSSL